MALREHIFNIIYDVVIAKEAICRDPCYALFCADILPILDLEYSRYEAEKAIESLLRSGVLNTRQRQMTGYSDQEHIE